MKAREVIVRAGIVVAFGSLMRPPFRIVQQKDRILVNNVEVYPIPRAIPTTSDGEYPKLQELIRKVKEELAVLKEVSYEKQIDMVSHHCEAAGYVPKITDFYRDVVVETKSGIGRILLMDDNTLATRRDAQEPTLGLEDKTVDAFFDALAEQLRAEGMVLFGRGYLSVVPSNFIHETTGVIENVVKSIIVPASISSEMRPWLRDLEVTAAIFNARVAEAYPAEKLSLITFHSDIWDVFLRMPTPRYPSLLAIREFPKLGLVTTMLDDCAISVSAWDSWLRKGARVYYNMSHGDIINGEVVIKVGNDRWGKPTHYFSASHVLSLQLRLPGSFIYNYSCHSLENPSMAGAFVVNGASAYLGWTAPASARPSVIDKIEKEVWSALVHDGENVAQTVNSLHNQSIVPMEVNGIEADFRFHGDGDTRLDV